MPTETKPVKHKIIRTLVIHDFSDRKNTITSEEYIVELMKHVLKKLTTCIALPSAKTYDLKVSISKKIDDLKQVQDAILNLLQYTLAYYAII